ncbi:FAD-dependent oxidoreductase [Streptomyces sp. NPDC050610]|uniref:FAD-dependent oxidoreductase n=1 Tax=Streptomyces sp. NPDC050610 TaxID=3157097 RepID=UPI00343B9990
MTAQQPKRIVHVEVDGCPQLALPGHTVAAVLLAMGRVSWRTTRDGGRPRGLFCGIGVCHDCLVAVNGLPDVRACRREVADGDRIETQRGAELPYGGRGSVAGEGGAQRALRRAGAPESAAEGRPGGGGAGDVGDGGGIGDAGRWAEGLASGTGPGDVPTAAGTASGSAATAGTAGLGTTVTGAVAAGGSDAAGREAAGPGIAAPAAADTEAGCGPRRPDAQAGHRERRPPAEPLVVVVGAGPAGMAAASAAARGGARVVLVDGGGRVGGQFHRRPPVEFPSGGRDHPLERAIADHPRIEYLDRADVWALEPGPGRRHLVHLQQGPADGTGRTARTLAADALVLCTGAYDRALPFPGWELPGVVTAGAAQALAKGQRAAIGRRVVVAGTGPFLLPVATALLAVGARVLGVYEAGSPARWLRHPVAAARDGGRAKASELSFYAAELARHRVPYRARGAVVAAHGRDRVEAVTVARLDARWRIRPGSERRLEGVDAVCVGYGFTPQLELALSAGCALRHGHVVVDARQATTVPGVYAAGELTGIAGADAAAAEGELAGVAAALSLEATRATAVGPAGALAASRPPAAPETPAEPTSPAAPAAADAVVSPAPASAVAPVAPETSAASTSPAAPAVPAPPTSPAAPAVPAASTSAAAPAAPAAPTSAAAPVAAAPPTSPAAPAVPAASTSPAAPAAPAPSTSAAAPAPPAPSTSPAAPAAATVTAPPAPPASASVPAASAASTSPAAPAVPAVTAPPAPPTSAAAPAAPAPPSSRTDPTHPTPPTSLSALVARVRSTRRFAALLADAHPVRDGWRSWLTDDTVVCRCEEVTYGQLRDAVLDRGADGMRVLKLTCRAGLGLCQGRVCGRNVAEIADSLLSASGSPDVPALADPHAADRRPIAHPIRLGDLDDLAGMDDPAGPREEPEATAP